MNAQEKDRALAEHIAANVVRVRLPKTGTDMDRSFATHNHMDVARTLRRAQLTLHRWAEEMCNGTIQRADEGGHPFRFNDRGEELYGPIPDRERGALARVEKVCKAAGLHWYYQRDPRGCALYVSAVPMTDTNYSQVGIPCI